MRRVYRVFGLRHGTIMVAVHDLLWSSFVMFLLVLATAHTRQVCRLVEGDVQDHLGDDKLVFQDDNKMQGNELKLHNGLHVATVMTMVMVFGISLAGIDIITSMMLLAGAVLNVRQLLMPWLSLRFIELLLLFGLALLFLFYIPTSLLLFKVLLACCACFCVVFYHWLAAYSLHEHLCWRSGLIRHHTRPHHGGHHDSSAASKKQEKLDWHLSYLPLCSHLHPSHQDGDETAAQQEDAYYKHPQQAATVIHHVGKQTA